MLFICLPGIIPQFYSFPRIPGFSPGTHKAYNCKQVGLQVDESSVTRFEPATFRLAVMRPTTLGKMVVLLLSVPASCCEQIITVRARNPSLSQEIIIAKMTTSIPSIREKEKYREQ
jgi:hypothetical protein